ncbi:site-2 protease family protein [Candidatus Dojkabacteria bacterium]|nr:site-2 protease family protein [Candidatus Dojkabacteria bacterium]
MINQIAWIIFSIPTLLISSSVHEFAHAWTAYKLGDYTARAEGRMTLNPLAHIDPIGLLLMIFVRFGWSKPVPVNEYNFKRPVLGMALTALAGPVSNLILAIIAALIYRVLPLGDIYSTTQTASQNFISIVLLVFIIVNLSLTIFNLIPLPPLDGHKIVRALLPSGIRYYWETLENYGSWILMLIFLPFSPLSTIIASYLNVAILFLLRILVS